MAYVTVPFTFRNLIVFYHSNRMKFTQMEHHAMVVRLMLCLEKFPKIQQPF